MAEIPVKPEGGGATKAKTWIWWVIAAIVVILLFFFFSNRSSASALAMPGVTVGHTSTIAAANDCPDSSPANSFRLAS